MDDYISRQMAMDSLNRAVCTYCVCPCDKPYSKKCNAVDNYSAGIRVIEALPSADAVEVIRCRDCARYDTHDHRCKYWNHGVYSFDYCSKSVARKQRNNWIIQKDEYYSGGGYFKCPSCHYEYSWGAFFELDEYAYCPKCGALLNEGAKNER